MSRFKKELTSGVQVLQTYCIAGEVEGKRECTSSDAHTIYAHPNEDGDGEYFDSSCFSCGQGFTKAQLYGSSVAEALGVEEGEVTKKIEFERKPKGEPMTKEQVKELMVKFPIGADITYRGIRPEIAKFFGHLYDVNSKGEVNAVYYPETRDKNAWPTGYKIRYTPKSWNKLGQTGVSSELAGQCKFHKHRGNRDVIIVGGEVDMPTVYQVLLDKQNSKKQESYAEVAVVSATAGEGSTVNQVRKQYEWLNTFENIYIGLDNDEAGITATKELIEVLPKEKVRVISWTYNDPNKMLLMGKSDQIISDFYSAKPLDSGGIFASGGLLPHVKEALILPRLQLPSFMGKLQDKTKGAGLIKNRIYNIIGNTSVGKCLAKGTLVLMFDGSTKVVEDITTDDLLMGPDGTKRKVLSLARGREEMFRIDQTKGVSYTVNKSHILSLKAGFDCKSTGYKKGDVVNISVKDWLDLDFTAKRTLKGYKAGLINLDKFIEGDRHKLKLGRKDDQPLTDITVTSEGEGDYYGFTIDGDHLFCLSDFTVTHNTTYVNAIVYELVHNPNELVAVVSLEATKGEYGIDLISLHLETNLYWKEADEVQEYLDDPVILEEINKLLYKEDGEDRFYVVDDRKGTVRSLEQLAERLHRQYGITILVIDVLTDLLRVTSNEDQASHMNWQSNYVKGGVTILNVLHTRKPLPNKDGTPKKCSEYDALGSSIFVQKAAGNIVINRNKEAPDDDPIEKNSTYVDVPKMRQGDTGQAGVWYYDPDSRRSYDRDWFFEKYPEKLPIGYDLTVSSFDKAYWEKEGTSDKDSWANRRNKTTPSSDFIEPVEDGDHPF